jgi:hypothetical protein
VFGVRPSEDLGYLLDVERGIIITEGPIPAVNAKVKEWEEVAPDWRPPATIDLNGPPSYSRGTTDGGDL